MGWYVPLVEDLLLNASFASSPVENRDALGLAFGGCNVPPFVDPGACRLSAGGTLFFWAFLLAIDRGLNIVDFFFDCVSTSDVSISGLRSVDGCAAFGTGLSTIDPPSALSSQPELSSTRGSGSLLNPGAAPVLRLTALPNPPLFMPPAPGPPFGAVVRLGAGRKALNPLKPPEPILARFVGGPDSSSPSPVFVRVGSGRLSLIL